MTPLFDCLQDLHNNLITFFEVLGIPEEEDIFYINSEIYQIIFNKMNQRKMKKCLLDEFTDSMSSIEKDFIEKILTFNPLKRLNIQEML